MKNVTNTPKTEKNFIPFKTLLTVNRIMLRSAACINFGVKNSLVAPIIILKCSVIYSLNRKKLLA